MNFFYTLSLYLHSWNRYFVLIAAAAVIFTTIKGFVNKEPFTNGASKSLFYYVLSLHLQLLLGLLLYFVFSPITTQALSNFGDAMKDSTARYWAVEHAFTNILAIALAQAGSIIAKRKKTDPLRHKQALIWTVVSIVLILAMIPSGMMGVVRPWFRF